MADKPMPHESMPATPADADRQTKPATPHIGRHAGGLWCDEVLALLSEFVEGRLAPSRAKQVQEHVHVCQECARFGADFAAMLDVVRAAEPAPPRLARGVLDAIEAFSATET